MARKFIGLMLILGLFHCSAQASAADSALLEAVGSKTLGAVLGSEQGGAFLEALVGKDLARDLAGRGIAAQRQVILQSLSDASNVSLRARFLDSIQVLDPAENLSVNLSAVEAEAKALAALSRARLARSPAAPAERTQLANSGNSAAFPNLAAAREVMAARVASGELSAAEAGAFLGTSEQASRTIGSDVFGAGMSSCVGSFGRPALSKMLDLVNVWTVAKFRSAHDAYRALVGRARQVYKESESAAHDHVCSITEGAAGARCAIFSPIFAVECR